MKRQGQSGFTLVEVLTAIAMLSVAIASAVSAYNSVTLGENRVQNFSRAHNIAISQLEQLIANYSTDANLTAGTHTALYDKNGKVTTGVAGSNPTYYTAKWIVTTNAPITNIMTVQLYVTWKENATTRTINFLTYRRT